MTRQRGVYIHRICFAILIATNNSTLSFPQDDREPMSTSPCARCSQHYQEVATLQQDIIEAAVEYAEKNTIY